MTEATDVMIYELRDGVAWLTMNRPEARNALNHALREGLRGALARFAADDGARVAVLRGAGPVFCAGADLKEMARDRARDPAARLASRTSQRDAMIDKPVIAAVQGSALAGGFLLAQMADLCVAADDAQFGITEARWGRGAPWAAPLPLDDPAARRARAADGRRSRSAPRRAYELGLVNRLARGRPSSTRSPASSPPDRRQRAALGPRRQAHGLGGRRAAARARLRAGRRDLGARLPQRGRAGGPARVPRAARAAMEGPLTR